MTSTLDADHVEFDRQVQTLVGLGYPTLAGRSERAFRAMVEPLRERVVVRGEGAGPTRERVPFVLVIGKKLVPVTQTMPLTSLSGRGGFVSADTSDIDRFEPVESVSIPDPTAYVVFDVDRGQDTLGVRPNDALVSINEAGRSPLTVDEGVAFVTQFPDSLEKTHCFQLLGSRFGAQRVPGLWISDRKPKLGFCWAGNMHSWLGAASCADRGA